MSSKAVDAPAVPKRRSPGRTKAEIVRVATSEFAAKGYTGARIDEIADLTQTSKRMIYYYYSSKEDLYREVLEQAYTGIRSTESFAELENLPPRASMARLVEMTFEYHFRHPEFVRLVMTENMQQGFMVSSLDSIRTRNESVVNIIGDILDRGVAEGVFRAGLDPINIHMTISALSFYNVSNRHTFESIFDFDMTSEDAFLERRRIVVDTVERFCLTARHLTDD